MNLRILVDKCNKKRGAKTMRGMLYLKIDRNNQVSHADVRLGDVAKLECVDASVKNRLKTMKLLKIQAPVSYTHLDVYKRQISCRSRWRI